MNSRRGKDWKVWDQAEDKTRSLAAFKGAEAARRQGTEAFEAFHYGLLKARHEDGSSLDRESVARVAESAGLDAARFREDLDSADILRALAEDHEGAVARGVFGTPTIFFGEGQGAYLKMRPASAGADAVRTFEWFRHIVSQDANIHEIKRPTP